MQRTILALIFVILFVFSSSALAGTPYYVNCEGSGTNAGTFQNPFLTVGKVNSTSFTDGDDVYFMSATTCDDAALDIDWDGESTDRSVIGCYWNNGGSPDTNCAGKTLPTIDGKHIYPTGESGLVDYDRGGDGDAGYVTIQDLHLYRSAWYDLLVKNADGSCSKNGFPEDDTTPCNIIQRNWIDRSGHDCPEYNPPWCNIEDYPQDGGAGGGLIVSWGNWNLIQDNLVQYVGLDENLYWHRRSSGLQVGPSSHANLIRRNVVRWIGAEALDLWHNADGNIFEYNIVYDGWAVNWYPGNTAGPSGNSIGNTIRYNIGFNSGVLPPLGGQHPNYGPAPGQVPHHQALLYDNETFWLECGTNLLVYSNLFAGGLVGIDFGNNNPNCVSGGSGVPPTGFRFINNTMIDNEQGINIFSCCGTTGWDNVFRNNNILTIDEAEAGFIDISSGDCSFNGIEWDDNDWSQDVSGNCDDDAGSHTGNTDSANITFEKMTGWRTIGHGDGVWANEWERIWNYFIQKYNSDSVNPASISHITEVDATDTGTGTSLVVDDTLGFRVGDYIVIGTTRTDVRQITAITIGKPGTLTIDSTISRSENDSVHLTPVKWGSQAHDSASGWYTTRFDRGGVQYAGDDEPTLTAEAEDQDHTSTITLDISARNARTGVGDSHDWSDFIVCTSGSTVANCLGSIVWSSYDETATPLTTDIPGSTLSANTNYWWTARTHNAWPNEGEWQSTPDAFSTSGYTPQGGDIGLLVDVTGFTGKWLLLDCEGEEGTGIKWASGATGGTLYNSTIINCGTTGFDIDESVTAKNILLNNNAGPDIDIATGKTVTADNNSIQDAAKIGDGTYSSGTSDFSKSEVFYDFSGGDLRLRRSSYGVDSGTSAIYSGAEKDIRSKDVTDGSGDPISGAGIDIGAFESTPFLTHGPLGMGLGMGLN